MSSLGININHTNIMPVDSHGDYQIQMREKTPRGTICSLNADYSAQRDMSNARPCNTVYKGGHQEIRIRHTNSITVRD